MRSLAEEDLKTLISMVGQDKGIDLGRYKDRYLRRRIGVRLRASGAFSLKQYMRILRRDEAEYRSFIDTVTINTSNFFRNSRCFELLAERVLPDLAAGADRASRRAPSILSVGCARGEEAYSLAILVSRFPEFSAGQGRPPILAVDIDDSSLAAAREGEYGKRSLEGIPGDVMSASFVERNGSFRVNEEIRGLVTFARHDILKDDLPGRFLLILCRNLLIYLEREAQDKLMTLLAGALHPGGYLVLGKSEILFGEARGMFKPLFPEERIYQRTGSADGPAEAEPGPRRRE